MKFKKSFLICMILLVIFSLVAVCAEDNSISDDLSENTQLNDPISINDTQITSKSYANNLIENNEIVSEENNLNPLNTNASTYSELFNEISSGGNITLKHDYYTYDSGDSIEITADNSIINGNGAIIDMARLHIRTFTVSASNVTIKNLTIKNTNVGSYVGGIGGAIYFSSYGTVENCNFIKNNAYAGGALYFRENGEVTNCNFTNNTAEYGGALYFRENGEVTNCNFTNNKATYFDKSEGGAIYSNNNIKATNCNFFNNTAEYGGAIFGHMGKVTKCNFTNNTATQSYGAICIMYLCDITNCNFTNNTATSIGAVYISMDGNIADCNFNNNTATSNAGAVYIYMRGEVTNCNFVNNTGNHGGAIVIDENVKVTNCNFTNNYAKYGGAIGIYNNGNIMNCNFNNDTAYYDGGAVYYDWACLGTVENCNFKNCYDENGNAIYGFGINVTNCNFTNDTLNTNSKHKIRNGTDTFNITFYNQYHIYGESNFFGFLIPNDIQYKPTVQIDSKPYKLDGPRDSMNPYLWVWGGDNKKNGYYVEFSDLKPGIHKVTISYLGDSKYVSCSFNKKITVYDVESEIIASNVKVTYSADTYYQIKIYNDNSVPADNVVVKVSGKISKKLKTKNGIAKFKVDQMPGKYKITISSLGKSVTKTITVNHIVTLKTTTVKKSAKKLTLQASLAKVNGKYLKNKQITFKFNGKTYKVKTNSKGNAKVTIPKSVLNKLKAGKKITYKATYLKDTIKKTVKIQK